MKRLALLTLAALLVGTGCQSRKPTFNPFNTTENTAVLDMVKGTLTTVDNTSRVGGQAGAVAASGIFHTDSGTNIWGNIRASDPRAEVSILVSKKRLPNFTRTQELKKETQDMATKLDQGLKTGNLAADAGLALLGNLADKLKEYKIATDQPELEGDETSYAMRMRMAGEGTAAAVVAAAGSLADAEKNSTNAARASVVSSVNLSNVDKLTPAGLAVLREEILARKELALAELAAKGKVIDNLKPTPKPDDAPPIVAPDPDDEDPTPPNNTLSFGVKVLDGPLPANRKDVFLWKPKNEKQPDKGSILIPAWMGKPVITVDGKAIDFMHFSLEAKEPRTKYLMPLGSGSNRKVLVDGSPAFVWEITIPEGGKRFERQLQKVESEQPIPVDPEPTPPSGALYNRLPATLTLSPALAAAVIKVDALTKINDPAFPGSWEGAPSVVVPATQSGNTWTIPEDLSSYPKGNRPNTWRLRLGGDIPAGVTYHKTIMQTFIPTDTPAGKFSPPTTR